MSKRCLACDRRAYLADVHCQRCGAAIVPPPPAWVAPAKRVGIGLYAVLLLHNGWHWLTHEAQGRAFTAWAEGVGRYLTANGGDIAGIFFAFVVAPLVGLYFALRAMVDIGDWFDLKTQQWRAERFRKYGW